MLGFVNNEPPKKGGSGGLLFAVGGAVVSAMVITNMGYLPMRDTSVGRSSVGTISSSKLPKTSEGLEKPAYFGCLYREGKTLLKTAANSPRTERELVSRALEADARVDNRLPTNLRLEDSYVGNVYMIPNRKAVSDCPLLPDEQPSVGILVEQKSIKTVAASNSPYQRRY